MIKNDTDITQLVLENAGVSKKELLERYDQIVQATVRQRTLYWDIDDLVRETRFSKASLEKYILCDPRIREHQRQIGSRYKRVWLAEPTAKIIDEILNNN
ncbi:hypothetical protein LBYS11_12275 [Lysinibacillus sp. YS11]|uniref:hypothetical protein n=1 Tax=unclassified Lysinibacillus TaxID=2636778 RepID=UPI000825C871|nr:MULTISPECIES: hypothetical protein [unclassified Lysinibacillus]AUS87055.1 hypothetical protein LBYS11_12275 [Lysinibacillus sp. YS11]OCX62705.1 hypothetical protein BFM98_01515 [Lysinibacillus sp. AR18-8]